MAVSITISIDQNSQSIANNTSNVTVTVRASWTGGSYNKLQKSGWLKIDGTQYNFTSSFNTGRTNTGVQVLFQKTVNIKHNTDGSKTLATSASYTSGVSSGTVGASASVELTIIPRKSSLSVSNGTLGTSLTLTVTKQASSFTHTITYKCGSASGTVCSKSSSTSIAWNTSNGNVVDLSSQNTTGTSVSVTFTITTYNGSTNVGSNTKTISMSIPSTVKPTCSISVTDPTGISDIYGGYVAGLSKFKVSISATQSYGSSISTYKTTANGATYTSASFTTGVLASSGTMDIKATVTDKRKRSGSDTESVTVIPYTKPLISRLTVERCNADGTTNEQGDHVKVTFSATASSINGKNATEYTLKYKRTTEDTFVVVPLTDYNGVYSVNEGSFVFEADTGSSYNIELDVYDGHNTTPRTTTASTGYVIMHWNVAGDGMGIGKVSELSNVLDIGMQTRFYGGILHPVLEPKTDLNDVRTPNTYIGANVSTYKYGNCPLTAGTFTLEVVSGGENGQVRQRIIKCTKTDQIEYERFYYTNAWGPWNVVRYEKDITFTPVSGVTITRYFIHRQGNTVTAFLCLKYSNAIDAGTSFKIGTIPTEDAPGNSVATVGISGSTGTAACWIRNDGSVNYRPNVAHAAGNAIEFNLSWNVAATWK